MNQFKRDHTVPLQTSIVKRLSTLIVLVGFAFSIEYVGIMFSNERITHGLAEVYAINQLYELTMMVNGNTETEIETLSHVFSNVSQAELRSEFEASDLQAVRTLGLLRKSTVQNVDIDEKLVATKTALDYMRIESLLVLAAQNQGNIKAERAHFLLASQHRLEVNEFLRGIQGDLEKISNRSFNRVYEYRNIPMLIALLLTVICLIFVTLIAHSIIKKLTASLNGLITAAQVVAEGDLSYRAPLVAQDELGLLTSAFNHMVERLSFNQNRLSRLQIVTSALSRSANIEQVGRVLANEGLGALGATGCYVVLNSHTTHVPELIGASGFEYEKFLRLQQNPLPADSPLAKAMKLGVPIWANDLEKKHEIASRSFAAIPLLLGDQVIGGIYLSFDDSKALSHEDREFYVLLAHQCAQALVRAQHYNEAKKAILVRDEFLSIASHELKTPITSLKLQLQLAQRSIMMEKTVSQTPVKVSRFLDVSMTQVNRLTDLVEELLDVSKIQAGKLELDKKLMNLNSLIDEVKERFSLLLEEARCEVIVHSEGAVIGSWDKNRVEQILVNLLSNAIKYAPGKLI